MAICQALTTAHNRPEIAAISKPGTKNLREALARVVDRYHKQVATAVQEVPAATSAATTVSPVAVTSPAEEAPLEGAPLTRLEELKRQRRARRLERYKRAVELDGQGVSDREIARQVGIYRGTVRRLLAAGCFPERGKRRYTRHTDSFADYLRQRWDDGCHNAAQLFAELTSRGFDGSYHMVRRRVAHWRSRRSRSVSREQPRGERRRSIECPSSNRIAWLLFRLPSELSPTEEAMSKAISAHCPPLASAALLAREFRELVKCRQAEPLDDWLQRARAAEGVLELQRFADGLVADLSAVKAALSLPWSNGQTEGHVNRLKLIKRQMFGRAKFDLLRQRVLSACYTACTVHDIDTPWERIMTRNAPRNLWAARHVFGVGTMPRPPPLATDRG